MGLRPLGAVLRPGCLWGWARAPSAKGWLGWSVAALSLAVPRPRAGCFPTQLFLFLQKLRAQKLRHFSFFDATCPSQVKSKNKYKIKSEVRRRGAGQAATEEEEEEEEEGRELQTGGGGVIPAALSTVACRCHCCLRTFRM